MNVLIGKKIRNIILREGEEEIYFILDDGVFMAKTDCCSETRISDIINPEFILNNKIVSIEKIEMPCVNDGRCRQEEDSCFYGIEIKTSKGVCTIAYRNSSNGYYGGDMNEGKMIIQGVLIKADYSA